MSYPAATGMWWGMMLVMMAPAAWPWLRSAGMLVPAGAPRSERVLSAPLFATGYAGVWLGFAVAAAGLQTGLHALSVLGPDMALRRPLAGTALIGVGLYQLTPLKAACLSHCRNPLTFFLQRWRRGPRGALSMGAAHGLFCVGCCWALMAAAFAVGVMSLLWMAALTAVVTAESLAPWGPRFGRWIGVAALGLGAWWLGSGMLAG